MPVVLLAARRRNNIVWVWHRQPTGIDGGLSVRATNYGECPGATRGDLGRRVADVLDGDVGFQTRHADTGPARTQSITEPAGVPSVPGAHVYLPTGAHDPYRHPSPQAAVGAFDSDPQLPGRIHKTQFVRRP